MKALVVGMIHCVGIRASYFMNAIGARPRGVTVVVEVGTGVLSVDMAFTSGSGVNGQCVRSV